LREKVSAMDVAKMLAEMRRELEILNAAIASLERLERLGPGERGPEIRKAARPSVRKGGAQALAETPKAE